MPRKPDPIKFCHSCGKQLTRKVFSTGLLEGCTEFRHRKFCDSECMGRGFQGRFKTDVIPAQGRYRARTIKRKTFCERCGAAKSLDVHHRDENPLNNELSNLMVLCRSCHMKMHRTKLVCMICGNPQKGRGYCNKHLIRLRKFGDPNYSKIPSRKVCSVCGMPANARGLCGKHYMQSRRSESL